jgi:hypothetical protein
METSRDMSTQVYTNSSSGHWYDREGNPVHEVPMKSKPGEMRNTTVADARKMSLVPSVTNILDVMDKPMLTAYKVNQGILAALTLPRIDGESLDDFAARAAEDSKQHAASAAALGTLCHSKIEAALLVKDMEEIDLSDVAASSPDAAANLKQFFNAMKPSLMRPCAVHELEFRVVHRYFGYAGTCDCILAINPDSPLGSKIREAGYGVPDGTNVFNCFADLKNRGCRSKNVPTYEADVMQLAAYSAAKISDCRDVEKFSVVANLFPHISLVVNTNASGIPCSGGTTPAYGLKIWEPDELVKAFSAFLHTFELWKFLKNYDPTAQ